MESHQAPRLTCIQRITHAGYPRAILRRNPKRFDEDGDEIDDDVTDEDADADAAARNPYSHITLEGLSSHYAVVLNES